MSVYHEEQLLAQLEHVRDGFARLDAGEIDAFDLDDLIHRYKQSACELWKFCSQSGAGWLTAARTLEHLQAQGEELPGGRLASLVPGVSRHGCGWLGTRIAGRSRAFER